MTWGIQTSEPTTAAEVIQRAIYIKRKMAALDASAKASAMVAFKPVEIAEPVKSVPPPVFDISQCRIITVYGSDPMMTTRPRSEIPGILYLRKIVAWVAKRHRMPPEAIYGYGRQAHVIKARHLAIAMIAHSPRLAYMSIAQIGRIMNRDHTSILHIMNKSEAVRRRRPRSTQWDENASLQSFQD